MDWSASASAPSSQAVFSDDVVFETPPDVVNGACLANKVPFWQRLDGVFVFRLDLDDTRCDTATLSIDDIIRLAAFISARIKYKLGFQNWALASVTEKKKDNASFPTISVCPIKLLDTIAADYHPGGKDVSLNSETIPEILCNEAGVFALRARPYGNKLSQIPEPVPAVFLIRRQFARNFETAMHFKEAFKRQTLKVPLIWRLSHRLAIPFRAYTWHAAIWSYLVVSLAYLGWHFARSFGEISVTAAHLNTWNTIKLYSSSAFEDALEGLLIAGFPAAVSIFIQVIVFRRHKTRQAYNKAITLLRLGNIYNGVMQKIMRGAKQPENETGFQSAIDIIEHLLRIENEKQRINIFWIILALTLCAGPFFNFVKEVVPEIPFIGPFILWIVARFDQAFDLPFL